MFRRPNLSSFSLHIPPASDISHFTMKQIAVLIALLFVSSAFADTPPAISARQALDFAEQNMTDRGLGKELYIESVQLLKPALFNGETYWFVKWSHPIPATDPNKIEVGIKVRMDGRVTRLVKGRHDP